METKLLRIDLLKPTVMGVFILLILRTPLSYAEGPKTTKEIWKQLMIMQTPDAFCSKEQYFGSCTNYSNDICKNIMSLAVKQCFEKYDSEIPEILNKQSGFKWGRYIGHCAGSIFMTTAVELNMKSSSSVCKDYQTWKQAK